MRIIKFLLFIFVALGVGKVYLRATDDFRMGNITHALPHRKEWEISPLSSSEKENLKRILDQEFTYLAKGAQCYVFLSKDDQYVLKLFKFKHLRPSPLTALLPDVYPFDRYLQEKRKKKEARLDRVFGAHVLAYEKFREGSGLVYIHLNKTTDLNQTVTLYDKIGMKWEIDLDPMVFVVQERSSKMRDEMDEILARGDLPRAKERIDQVLQMYLSQYEIGVYDFGHGVMHNNGFVGEKAIHYDVEKFLFDHEMRKQENYQENFEKMAFKMRLWVERNYPEYVEEISHHIEGRISENYGRSFKF